MSKCKDCVASLLGVCRGDFCLPERTALVERASRIADGLGHSLAEFSKVEGQPVWETRCERCGLHAVIGLDPEPGHPAITGGALTDDCLALESASSEAPHGESAAD